MSFRKTELHRTNWQLILRAMTASEANSHRAIAKHIVLAMKLTTVFLLTAALHVCGRTVSQTVTLSVRNVPIKQVFEAVKKQTGYSVFYDKDLLEKALPVTINVQDMSINEFLSAALKDQPFGYYIENENVIIRKKASSITDLNPRLSFATSPPITGIVRGPDGQPLSGVNIVVKGTKRGTTSDGNGQFNIEAGENDVLVISSVGYATKEIKVKEGKNLSVVLALSTSPLDEVQIIAYGQTSKRFQTGNVTSIKAEEIEKQPVQNPLLALQGRVPGLFITQANGLPGGGVTVRIQGQNSIRNGNDPLYVIDGVPVSSQTLPTMHGGILGSSGASEGQGGGFGNPLNYLNPADIVSIEVLKDADATAIYGSRAANGAILITTKSGQPGPMLFDLKLQKGWGKNVRRLDMMNTEQYLEMRKEAFKNDNLPLPSIAVNPNDVNHDINGLWDTTRYTDWQKELIGNTAQYDNITASICGGNSSMQYLVSGTYHKQTSVFPGEFNDRRGSIHFNLKTKSVNQKFSTQLSANYLNDLNRLPQADITNIGVHLAPNAPALYNTDGTYNWAVTPSGAGSWDNPIAALENNYENKTTNLVSNATFSYQFLPQLELTTTFGYTTQQTDEFSALPLTTYRPELLPYAVRHANYSDSRTGSLIAEPQLHFNQHVWKGKLDALLGLTFNERSGKGEFISGSGYNSDAVLKDIRSASTVTINNTTDFRYRYNAVFGRLNHNLLDRYIVNLSARRDGSSNFGPENRFQNFYSAGGAWIFTEEKFLHGLDGILSFGKLKASYGTTGNDQIGNYRFMDLYAASTNYGVPYQNSTGLNIQGLPNPYLQWEETKKLYAGLDLGFIRDRVLVNLGYSRNRSSNQLLNFALPIITGTNGIAANFPAVVENETFEASITTTNIQTENVSWTTNFNITLPKNSLVSFPGLETSTYASQLIIGEPLTISRAFKFIGVDPISGLYQIADKDGNAVPLPDYSTDQTELINTMPKLFGGFSNSISFKGFQLDFLFQFLKQTARHANAFSSGPFPAGRRFLNQPVRLLSRWQNPGEVSAFQRFSAGFDAYQQLSYATASDAFYTDASYARLKNLALSYQIPERWTKTVKMRNVSLFLQCQNLLTITSFEGLDPETSALNLPPLRVITFGAQISL